MQSLLQQPTTGRSVSPAWRRSGRRLAGWTADLLADLVRGPSAPSEPPPAMPPPVRYRHPVLGLGWDGHGRQPQWLRDAVLHEGYLLAQLRCAVVLPS